MSVPHTHTHARACAAEGSVGVSHARGRVGARARTGVVGEERGGEERGCEELARIDTEQHGVSRNCVATRFPIRNRFRGRKIYRWRRRICNS